MQRGNLSSLKSVSSVLSSENLRTPDTNLSMRLHVYLLRGKVLTWVSWAPPVCSQCLLFLSSPSSTPSASASLHPGEPQGILEKPQAFRKAPWGPNSSLTGKEVGPHNLEGPCLFQWPLVVPSLQPPLLSVEACGTELRG